MTFGVGDRVKMRDDRLIDMKIAGGRGGRAVRSLKIGEEGRIITPPATGVSLLGAITTVWVELDRGYRVNLGVAALDPA